MKPANVPVRRRACPIPRYLLDRGDDLVKISVRFERLIPDVSEKIRASYPIYRGGSRDERLARAGRYDREGLIDRSPPVTFGLSAGHPTSNLLDDRSSTAGRHETIHTNRPATSLTANNLRRLLRTRQEREDLFGTGLFSDPAWDILLVLAISLLEDRQISVTSTIDAAGVSGSTGLRYLKMLESKGLVIRQPDPRDRRRYWLSLSPRATLLLTTHFAKPGAWS